MWFVMHPSACLALPCVVLPTLPAPHCHIVEARPAAWGSPLAFDQNALGFCAFPSQRDSEANLFLLALPVWWGMTCLGPCRRGRVCARVVVVVGSGWMGWFPIPPPPRPTHSRFAVAPHRGAHIHSRNHTTPPTHPTPPLHTDPTRHGRCTTRQRAARYVGWGGRAWGGMLQ